MKTSAYDEMAPAYRYGWESRAKHHDKSWNEAEPHLEHDWSSQRGTSTLEWERARHAYARCMGADRPARDGGSRPRRGCL